MENIDREQFWTKLDQYWSSGDLEKFRAFWQANPKYIQEFNENYERQMADPNSALRKKQDAWREKQKAKRIAELDRDV